jgi:succinate dehydrogenase/fumarate reductase flavoprotein subunit
MHYEDFESSNSLKWPYSVNYGKENELNCDVLVLGGGIAGCWAAIGAARKGAKVIMVEKGVTSTSGAGGSGVDHWHAACTNPACTITPEELAIGQIQNFSGWRSGISQYITCRESYDCLLELEKMGVKIRDSQDEFAGAAFRDEATKLLFAYDYRSKYCVRIWGSSVKASLNRECTRLGVKIFNHVMVTGLLNQNGQIGSRVVGATGVNIRNGEFYVFKGKASVLAMFLPQRTWIFSTELKGLTTSHRPHTSAGDGHAMAWRAGAQFAGMEGSRPSGGGPYGYPQYGVGNKANTWYACTLVDATGKEIPWVDRDGKVLKSVAERYQPAPGQKFFIADMSREYNTRGPTLSPDWEERVRKGEFKLPIYADIPGLPAEERKALWGLMIAQEARTQIPIYWTYNQAGFDPQQDMLQYYDGSWSGLGLRQWRDSADIGGPIVDWNLMTTLDGLFAAGGQIFANGDHAYAAATGRYAGRQAANRSAASSEGVVDRNQIEKEKERVYAPVKRRNGIDWKELNAGVCKIMQDYCGELKNEELLNIGLKWFSELAEGEAQTAYSRNPHELSKTLEVFNIMTVGQMILEASKARQCTTPSLGFFRQDFPQIDPPDWRQWVTLKQGKEGIQRAFLAKDYHGDLKNNYESHCGI